jgi:hypothetical protein
MPAMMIDIWTRNEHLSLHEKTGKLAREKDVVGVRSRFK